MNSSTIFFRNKITHGIYAHFLKPIFFLNDPERVHNGMTKVGIWLGNHLSGQKLIWKLFGYQNPVLEQKILGINFKNPVGLSAGFDKNAQLMDILPSIGFGFAEVGSITGNSCAGNPKPRLWRLPKSKSLVVYYGLKNDGTEAVAARLRNKKFVIPTGISIAKTNSKDTVEIGAGINDYIKTCREFA